MKTQATVLVAVQMVLFATLAGALFLLPAAQIGWLRILGILLAVLGLIVIFLAIFNHWQINRSMVNVSPEPNAAASLVQSGLYARIRHPIYSGVMLAGLGAALAHGHWLPLLIALGLVVFFSYKSTFEERWLMQVYPGYADYRQRAGRFLPRW